MNAWETVPSEKEHHLSVQSDVMVQFWRSFSFDQIRKWPSTLIGLQERSAWMRMSAAAFVTCFIQIRAWNWLHSFYIYNCRWNWESSFHNTPKVPIIWSAGVKWGEALSNSIVFGFVTDQHLVSLWHFQLRSKSQSFEVFSSKILCCNSKVFAEGRRQCLNRNQLFNYVFKQKI